MVNTKIGKEHPVSFQGDITKDTYYNFMYWFNRHLQQNHGISLMDLATNGTKQLAGNTTKLWQWNKTAMSYKFR